MRPLTLQLRPFLAADLDVQMSLVELAGWNQLHGDLRRLWEHQPEGCFVGVVENRTVATITTTSHGADLAWIGMMLVHPEFRRQGIASALMNHAIDWLERQGIGCIKLDATAEGAAVYAQLGFHSEYGLKRYRRDGDGAVTSLPAASAEFTIPESDRVAFGADRSEWLNRLARDSRVEVVDEAYGMLRPGRLAWYLGPLVANSPDVARRIVAQLLKGLTGPVFWDLPDGNAPGVALAREFGFEPVRELTRMWRGSRSLSGRPEWQYGLTDFATG